MWCSFSKLNIKFSDKFLCLIFTSTISSRMNNVSDIKTHVVVIKWKAKHRFRAARKLLLITVKNDFNITSTFFEDTSLLRNI